MNESEIVNDIVSQAMAQKRRIQLMGVCEFTYSDEGELVHTEYTFKVEYGIWRERPATYNDWHGWSPPEPGGVEVQRVELVGVVDWYGEGKEITKLVRGVPEYIKVKLVRSFEALLDNNEDVLGEVESACMVDAQQKWEISQGA